MKSYSGLLFCLLISWTLLLDFSEGDPVLSRIVKTKYGKVQGIIRHHSRPTLPPIEIYLGVPYASPPIGEGRFTPTSSPLPWDHVQKCNKLPPACPQPLWGKGNVGKEGSVPEDVNSYYETVRPILKNQNEDCLYLNIYAPHDGGGKYAVMVYIHGESFSWGSGNLYDGGTLASYGQIVVITVNYRLGPFGFLNTSPGGSRSGVVSNQGLMDQLAALSWVQENVLFFGGDPKKVTLVGHSTGAACVGYLLASPVLVPGLFHRAVLMSGSALSPWAEVPDALSVTVRFAKLLNCSVPLDLNAKHPETVSCLRNATTQQLVDAMMPRYKFASVFGPSVDGVVVAENFKERLSRVLKDRRVDLLFGVTEGDGYPDMTANQIKRGLSLAERNRVFRTFVRNTYSHHLQEIYLTVAKEYTDWENPSQHPLQVRDWTIEAVSDGSFLAPLIRFADIVSSRSYSFMYVFTHHEADKERLGSIFRSEVPLLFGVPFQDSQFSGSPSSISSSSNNPFTSSFQTSSASSSTTFTMTAITNFSRSDALVSEYLMRYWSNFAKSGHPDLPDETHPILSFHERTKHKNVSWEKYDQTFEKYLEISSRPRLRDHFRAHKVALWNWLIPELEDAGAKYPEVESEIWHTSENARYFIGPVRPLNPYRFLNNSRYSTKMGATPSNRFPIDGILAPNVSAAQRSPKREFNISKKPLDLEKASPLLDYTTALTLTVAIGLSLLVLNVILFAALLYKRERSNNLNSKMQYDSVSAQPLCTVDSGLRSTPTNRGSLTPPGKELQSSCGSSDQQCTELRSFPTPPDIGDRNTEVTFHNSSSVHSILSQPTSQFIPPPPLLATTPPTPPVNSITSEMVSGETFRPPRSFSSLGPNSFSEGVNPYPDDPPSQYHTDISENKYPPSQNQVMFQEIPMVEQYINNQNCMENQSSCPVSASCSYASTSCSSSQYCSSQCGQNVAGQYSKNSDAYNSPSYSGSPCQFNGAGDSNQISYYPESSMKENINNSSVRHVNTGKQSRSATLTRQNSATGSGKNSSSSTSRKPQPPTRTTGIPSFATLPRPEQKHKDSGKK